MFSLLFLYAWLLRAAGGVLRWAVFCVLMDEPEAPLSDASPFRRGRIAESFGAGLQCMRIAHAQSLLLNHGFLAPLSTISGGKGTPKNPRTRAAAFVSRP
jgi:hypothetical protein